MLAEAFEKKEKTHHYEQIPKRKLFLTTPKSLLGDIGVLRKNSRTAKFHTKKNKKRHKSIFLQKDNNMAIWFLFKLPMRPEQTKDSKSFTKDLTPAKRPYYRNEP